MRVADAIRKKLTEALAPERLEVVDESDLHAGHAGARPGGQTHFRVEIVSSAFEGMTKVARQRAVYDLLAAEMASQIHALSLPLTLTPREAERR